MKEAVFKGSMQQVWLAAEKALSSFPIEESNIDSGVLKTDFLRGEDCFQSPEQSLKFSTGVRCSLTLQFAKLPGSGVRIRVIKKFEILRDFISEPENMPEDGLEEMALLYRIDREITLAREIERKAKDSE